MNDENLTLTRGSLAALKLLLQPPYFTRENRPSRDMCDRLAWRGLTAFPPTAAKDPRKTGCHARLSAKGKRALEAAGVDVSGLVPINAGQLHEHYVAAVSHENEGKADV